MMVGEGEKTSRVVFGHLTLYSILPLLSELAFSKFVSEPGIWTYGLFLAVLRGLCVQPLCQLRRMLLAVSDVLLQ